MAPDSENYSKLSDFFREEYLSLKGYVRSRIDDTAESDAEDIIQEVALNVFSRAQDLTPINNIAGFVYHAVRNRIVDILRTRKSRSYDPEEVERRWTEFAETFYVPSEKPYGDGMVKQLKSAMGRLKPAYRQILIAVDFEGLTYREISGETGIPPGTLMSRRHRALSLLQNELKKQTLTKN